MNFVPIVPHGAESILDEVKAKRVFAFADIVLKDESYATYFRNTSALVILDHPVYELEEPLDLWDTIKAIETIEPHIATVPDVHENYYETIKKFMKWARPLSELTCAPRLMAVPQGRTRLEILRCAMEMWETGFPDIMGIGIKRSMPDLDRFELVDILHEYYPSMKFHLLGARWPYQNEWKMKHLEWVESMDSAEPTNAALNGYRFWNSQTNTRRPETFQQDAFRVLNIKEKVIWNIQSMMNAFATQTVSSPVDQ